MNWSNYGRWRHPKQWNELKRKNNMKEFFKDLETFVEKQWKPLLVILIVGFLLTNYSDIKSGIIDGWLNK